MIPGCGECMRCPFCSSTHVEMFDHERGRCECLVCDEEWFAHKACGIECELDHDFKEDE